MIKKLTVILLAIFAVSIFSVDSFAANTEISLSYATAEPGETVEIELVLENNPGIVSANLKLDFDEGLTLIDAANGDTFSTLTYIPPKRLSLGEGIISSCQFAWTGFDIDDEDICDGKILTLVFEVPDDAEDGDCFEINISSNSGDVIDRDLNSVVLSAQTYIEVCEEEILPVFEFEIDEGEAILKAYNGESSEVVIPSEFKGCSVTEIGCEVFCKNEEITKVVLPDTLKIINESAFDSCSNLKEITIPDSIEEIWYCAFAYSGLENIVMPDKPIKILSFAFYRTPFWSNEDNWEDHVLYAGKHLVSCGSDEDYLPDFLELNVKPGTLSIAGGVCGEMSDIVTVTIPLSVKCILTEAFSLGDGVKDVYYEGTESQWNDIYVTADEDGDNHPTVHFNSIIPGSPSHTHSYTSAATTPATCTTTGIRTFSCECGDTYTEAIAKTGHNSNVNIPAVSATCTNTGLTVGKKCSTCGTITAKQQIVAKTSHKEVSIAGKEATYTSTGLTAGKRCSVCNTETVKPTATKKLSIKNVKVTGLKAKKVKVAKSSEITLTWTSLGEGVKYDVYVKNGSKWTKLTTTSKTSYTVKKDGKKKALKAGKSYEFKVRAVVETSKKNYNGSYSEILKVKIAPKAPILTVKAGNKKLTASWKSISGVSGYEVQYSTSKKMKSAKKVSAKKSSKKTTIKKLKTGKKYYVRVRTYKTVNGKKIYSSWSTVRNVKVK